jgi:hypothetical protein
MNVSLNIKNIFIILAFICVLLSIIIYYYINSNISSIEPFALLDRFYIVTDNDLKFYTDSVISSRRFGDERDNRPDYIKQLLWKLLDDLGLNITQQNILLQQNINYDHNYDQVTSYYRFYQDNPDERKEYIFFTYTYQQGFDTYDVMIKCLPDETDNTFYLNRIRNAILTKYRVLDKLDTILEHYETYWRINEDMLNTDISTEFNDIIIGLKKDIKTNPDKQITKQDISTYISNNPKISPLAIKNLTDKYLKTQFPSELNGVSFNIPTSIKSYMENLKQLNNIYTTFCSDIYQKIKTLLEKDDRYNSGNKINEYIYTNMIIPSKNKTINTIFLDYIIHHINNILYFDSSCFDFHMEDKLEVDMRPCTLYFTDKFDECTKFETLYKLSKEQLDILAYIAEIKNRATRINYRNTLYQLTDVKRIRDLKQKSPHIEICKLELNTDEFKEIKNHKNTLKQHSYKIYGGIDDENPPDLWGSCFFDTSKYDTKQLDTLKADYSMDILRSCHDNEPLINIKCTSGCPSNNRNTFYAFDVMKMGEPGVNVNLNRNLIIEPKHVFIKIKLNYEYNSQSLSTKSIINYTYSTSICKFDNSIKKFIDYDISTSTGKDNRITINEYLKRFLYTISIERDGIYIVPNSMNKIITNCNFYHGKVYEYNNIQAPFTLQNLSITKKKLNFEYESGKTNNAISSEIYQYYTKNKVTCNNSHIFNNLYDCINTIINTIKKTKIESLTKEIKALEEENKRQQGSVDYYDALLKDSTEKIAAIESHIKNTIQPSLNSNRDNYYATDSAINNYYIPTRDRLSKQKISDCATKDSIAIQVWMCNTFRRRFESAYRDLISINNIKLSIINWIPGLIDIAIQKKREEFWWPEWWPFWNAIHNAIKRGELNNLENKKREIVKEIETIQENIKSWTTSADTIKSECKDWDTKQPGADAACSSSTSALSTAESNLTTKKKERQTFYDNWQEQERLKGIKESEKSELQRQNRGNTEKRDQHKENIKKNSEKIGELNTAKTNVEKMYVTLDNYNDFLNFDYLTPIQKTNVKLIPTIVDNYIYLMPNNNMYVSNDNSIYIVINS